MDEIEKAISDLISILHKTKGWFNDEEMENTPRRIRQFIEEWSENEKFRFTMFDTVQSCDQLIILKDINFYSMCAHHCLPYFGKVHVAYLPDGKICGVSKLARSVLANASRPSVQEALTDEIAEMVRSKTNARFVMVIIEAQHLCMLMRGVKQSTSMMTTSALRQTLDDEVVASLKAEALKLIKG